jgi:hypothetical protein
MRAFALAAEQAQQLDRPVAEAAEPVRDPRVELDERPVTVRDTVLRAARRR